jgi:hypothetical protein
MVLGRTRLPPCDAKSYGIDANATTFLQCESPHVRTPVKKTKKLSIATHRVRRRLLSSYVISQLPIEVFSRGRARGVGHALHELRMQRAMRDVIVTKLVARIGSLLQWQSARACHCQSPRMAARDGLSQ